MTQKTKLLIRISKLSHRYQCHLHYLQKETTFARTKKKIIKILIIKKCAAILQIKLNVLIILNANGTFMELNLRTQVVPNNNRIELIDSKIYPQLKNATNYALKIWLRLVLTLVMGGPMDKVKEFASFIIQNAPMMMILILTCILSLQKLILLKLILNVLIRELLVTSIK